MTEWSGLRQRMKSISASLSAPARSGRSARFFDEARKDIWAAVEARKLQLPIDQVYRFADVSKAFEYM